MNSRLAEILKPTLDQILSQGIEQGIAPGVVAMITGRDGLHYEGAFGDRVASAVDGDTTNEPMTIDTVGWIASMTKALVGACAMRQVELGRVTLDQPGGEILPELADLLVLTGFDTNGEPRLRPAKSSPTLRQLLTHTSGFVYDNWNSNQVRYRALANIAPQRSGKREALRVPLGFDPGSKWEYGIGIDVVGRIIEVVSGNRLGDELASTVLLPLGMTSTGFEIDASMAQRSARIHVRTEGGWTHTTIARAPNPELQSGGGGLWGSMSDYTRFVRMMLNEGRNDDGHVVLRPETIREMSTNQMGDLRVERLHTALPHLTNDAEFFPGVSKSWGLTFQINEDSVSTGRPAGSLSWAGLANSYYWIDQQNGIAGVFLTQVLPFADPRIMTLNEAFESAVYVALKTMHT